MTLRDTWSLYESGWNIADPAQRLAILRQALDLDFIYCDPAARTQGHDELSRYISEVHKNVPGMRIISQSMRSTTMLASSNGRWPMGKARSWRKARPAPRSATIIS